jgi:N12 class adenine-specific DNA methylase
MRRGAEALIPHELRGYTPAEQAQPGAYLNPRTGRRSTVGADETLAGNIPATNPIASLLASPITGTKKAIGGAEQMAEPGTADKLRGAGKVLTGATEAASLPMMAMGGMMAAKGILPALKVIGWLSGSQAAGYVGRKGGEAAGLNPEDAAEMGDVASALPLVAGTVKGGVDALGEQHAQIGAEAQQQFQAKGDVLDPARQAFGSLAEPLKIQLKGPNGPVDAEIQTHGADKSGNPFFKVVTGDGKTVYAGKPSNVSEWLGQRAASPEGLRQSVSNWLGNKAIDATKLPESLRSSMQQVSDWMAKPPEGQPSTAQVQTPEQAQLAREQGVLTDQGSTAAPVQAVHPELADLPTPDQANANAEAQAQAVVEHLTNAGEAINPTPAPAPAAPTVPIAPEWDLSSKVQAAQDLATQSDATGHPVKAFAQDPETTQMAATMQNGPDAFRAALDRFHDYAAMNKEGAPVQAFEPPNRQEAFQMAFGKPPAAPAPEEIPAPPAGFTDAAPRSAQQEQAKEVTNDNGPSVSVERPEQPAAKESAKESGDEQGKPAEPARQPARKATESVAPGKAEVKAQSDDEAAGLMPGMLAAVHTDAVRNHGDYLEKQLGILERSDANTPGASAPTRDVIRKNLPAAKEALAKLTKAKPEVQERTRGIIVRAEKALVTPAAKPVTPQAEAPTKYVLPSFVTAQQTKAAKAKGPTPAEMAAAREKSKALGTTSFMNEHDIDERAEREKPGTVIGDAAAHLKDFKEAVNDSSDGWPHWKSAPAAAQRLMSLVQKNKKPTPADLAYALQPMTAFRTKHKMPAAPTFGEATTEEAEPPHSYVTPILKPETPAAKETRLASKEVMAHVTSIEAAADEIERHKTPTESLAKVLRARLQDRVTPARGWLTSLGAKVSPPVLARLVEQIARAERILATPEVKAPEEAAKPEAKTPWYRDAAKEESWFPAMRAQMGEHPPTWTQMGEAYEAAGKPQMLKDFASDWIDKTGRAATARKMFEATAHVEPKAEVSAERTPEEQEILERLGRGKKTTDELKESMLASNLDFDELNKALIGLIKKGLVLRNGDEFRRAPNAKPVPPKTEAPPVPKVEQAKAEAPAETERRLLAAVEKLEEAGVQVSSPRLRAELADVPKAAFDKAAVALQQRRVVYGSTHDHPAQLSDADREKLIDTGRDDVEQQPSGRMTRRYWVALQRLEAARPETVQTETEKPAKIEQAADDGANTTTPADSAVRPDGGAHPAPLAGVPAADVRPTASPRETPSERGGGGTTDSGSVERVDKPGTSVQPSVGVDPRRVGVTAEREGRAEPLVRPGDLTRETSSRDWRISDADQVGEGTTRERLTNNLEAIRVVKKLAAENRLATEDERKALIRYVGWGGLSNIFNNGYREWAGHREELENLLTQEEFAAARASTTNAHYTSPLVVRNMWAALEHMGLTAGHTMIEPAVGIGNFLGLQPDSLLPGTRRTGVEMDHITAAIARALYPDSNIQNAPYQKVAFPSNFFDLAISNVPFGNFGVNDSKFRKHPELTRSIHDYYFAKALDNVRPGGIVAFITSHYTMDKLDSTVRDYLAEHADLLGAIRLPDTAFKGNAGTDVVTDMIFLRKRAPGEQSNGVAWTKATKVALKGSKTGHTGGEVPMSEYFQQHPEMVIGEHAADNSMYGNEPSLTVHGTLTPEKLLGAISNLPRNVYQEWKADTPAFQGNEIASLGDAIKDGGYTIKNGVIVQRSGAVYRPTTFEGKVAARIKGMIPVRDATHEVYRTQYEEQSAAKIKAARQKLNQVYDDFVKEHGPINTPANLRAFADDPDIPVISALEDYDSATKTAKKTQVFSERTIQRPKPAERADSASDALNISLNERGRVDWARMQDLTGKTPAELREELGGLVYQNPEGQAWEPADEYLSGSVRDKLDLAKAAAEVKPEFKRNVEALEKVIPIDIPAEGITANLGSSWIPRDVIKSFIVEKLGLPSRETRVEYSPAVAEWSIITPKYAAETSVANKETWGTGDVAGHELVGLALNSRSIRIYRKDADGNSVLDAPATAAADTAMQNLKDEFQKWVWGEARRSTDLSTLYNRQFNGLRLRDLDGSHLTLPGSNPAIHLRAHQKDAIWRCVTSGNTLLAHEVGAGKTWEMVGAAMELRRLGLARKPMMVVPNHMVTQFSTEFMQLYPSARILAVGRDEMSKDKRQRAIARIASGNYDAVIVAHSSFGKIGVSDEVYKKFIGEQITELENALKELGETGEKGKKSRTVKEIEKAKARLEAKLEKRLKAENKDKSATFEQLGVDQLFVDEAHAYKNLPVITKRSRIAGIPTAESDRSMDMLMKIQHVTAPYGGKRGVVFATGTPITNTMAELYNLQRYLQMNQLRELGLQHFDAWANTFGEPRRGIEMDVTGGFRENTRFAKFVNLPELLTMFRQVADVKTAEMMKLPRPTLATGGVQAITAPETPELAALKVQFGKRAEAIRGGSVDPRADNMLKIVSEGKKAALDLRLMFPNAPDYPDSKVNKAVAKIFDIWKSTASDKLTQVAFIDMSTPKARKAKKKVAPANDDELTTDGEGVLAPEGAGERAGFSVYDDMKAKLISMGVPSNELSFIHDADTDDAKQELFDAVNRGDVRIVLGSTEKMGTGTNMQRRMVALHHLDTPWRPSDVAQRNGRIQRQGNINKEVQVYQYLTEGSLDAYSWQTLENKDRFISQVMNGDLTVREAEDIGLTVPSAAEWKAISSGNPLIREKIGVDSELQKVDAARAAFNRQQAGVRSQLANLPMELKTRRALLARVEKDAKTVGTAPTAEFTVGRKKFTGDDARKDAASAFGVALKSWEGPHEPQMLGKVRALEIWTRPTAGYPGVELRGEFRYDANSNPENPGGTLQSIENVARGLENRADTIKNGIEVDEKKLADLNDIKDRTFTKEARYQELLKRKAVIDKELDINKETAPAMADETADPAQAAIDARKITQGGFLKIPLGDPDAAKVNYSGLGALEDVAVRNLSQLRRASPVAWESGVRAAASKSEASVAIKTAMPKIEAALGSDHSLTEFRRGLIESRLQGIEQRWTNMADFARRATDANLAKSADRLLPLLAHVEDRTGFERNLEDTAASLLQKKDFDSLRALLGSTFDQAAAAVTHVMPQTEFDATRYSPRFQDALAIYKKLLEEPMAQSHESNEGVFSDALGPLATYYPLVPLRDEDDQKLRTASKQQYSRPKNIANNFATGLSKTYDDSMDAFRDRMTRAIKANNKAAFIDSLKAEGLVLPLRPGEASDSRILYRGQEYDAVRMETTPARLIIQAGKTTHIPPHSVLVPKWLHKELEPILQNQYSKPTLSMARQIAGLVNQIAISGPADFVFHSANLFGTLVANTPFLGTSFLDKSLSLPLLKRFTAIVKVATMEPEDAEAAVDLQAMSKLGMLPDRYASETYSRPFSELTGAKLARYSLSPFLSGPRGVDVRARLVMYRLAKEINPAAGGPDLHMFVNQLGNYVDALQGQLERSAKHVGLSPFATAGSTMLRNGINAWTGQGPMPKSGASLRIWQQLTGGAVGLVALWALAQKEYTGKWPWQDKRSKLLQIPINPEDRHSALGQQLWGKGPEVGYVNFTMFNPLVGRGSRALGIKGAVDKGIEGGTWWQMLEAAQRDMMNAYAHPWLGPIPRAVFVGLTGDEPYVTSLRDDRAKFNPQLMPAVRNPGEGASILKRAGAAAKELNSFYGNVAANTGFGEPAAAHDTTNHWTRMVADLSLPGTVGNGQNPGKQAAYTRRQAAAAKRQK